MLRVRLEASRVLNDPRYLCPGARLYATDEQNLGLKVTSKDCSVSKPNGDLLFMLVRNAIPRQVWYPAYQLLRTVSGNLSNRPNIIGQNLRLPTMRKDGSLSNFNMAPKAVVDQFGGNADLLGYYRYKNPAPGVVDCAPTAWTQGESDLYLRCQEFIRAVDEVYRLMLPAEYKRQQSVIQAVPAHLRILDTAFTTLYVLRNAPTAIHTDDFDAAGTFGCMASLGQFSGNALIWPKYRIGVDYQPGDVLLADVHEYHGNLPLLRGERVSCVFFVRTGMEECPAEDHAGVQGNNSVRSRAVNK
jgi:hypothetical protein